MTTPRDIMEPVRSPAARYAAGYGDARVRAPATPDAGSTRAAVAAGITGLPALRGALVARSARPGAAAMVAACAPLGRAPAGRVSPT